MSKILFFDFTIVNIEIQSDFDIDNEKLAFWINRFCCKIVKQMQLQLSTPDFIVQIRSFTTISSRTDIVNHLVEIRLPNLQVTDYPWIAKYISQIVEYFLESNSMCSIHATCVSSMGNAVLLVGDYWQGKTSSGLYTVKKHKEVSLLADNSIIFYDNRIIGFNEMLSLHESNVFMIGDDIPICKHSNRLFYKNYSERTICKYKAIIIPHINDGNHEVRYISRDEAVWYLYQKISTLISGETILFNGEIPSPSLDNKVFQNNRLAIVKMLINKPVIYISASIDVISNIIYKLLCGEEL